MIAEPRRLRVTTVAAPYLPPSRAELLPDGRVVVTHVGVSTFASLDEARAAFPATEFAEEPAP